MKKGCHSTTLLNDILFYNNCCHDRLGGTFPWAEHTAYLNFHSLRAAPHLYLFGPIQRCCSLVFRTSPRNPYANEKVNLMCLLSLQREQMSSDMVLPVANKIRNDQNFSVSEFGNITTVVSVFRETLVRLLRMQLLHS